MQFNIFFFFLIQRYWLLSDIKSQQPIDLLISQIILKQHYAEIDILCNLALSFISDCSFSVVNTNSRFL